jgi:tetratricopeptide (TPR) repeat protein
MDDFSLLSISFEGETEQERKNKEIINNIINSASDELEKNNSDSVISILEKAYIDFKDDIHLVKYMLKTYIRFKQFERGMSVSKEYLLKNEGDTNLLMNAAYCFKMSKDIETAIDLGERVKLRDPRNVKNLLHLADMYVYTKNFKRAQKLTTKVLSIEPKNDQAILINSKINTEDKI